MYLAVFWCIVGSERLCLIFFFLFFFFKLMCCFFQTMYSIIAVLWSTVGYVRVCLYFVQTMCCFVQTICYFVQNMCYFVQTICYMCIQYIYSSAIVYCWSCTVVSSMVSCLDRMPRYHLHGLSDCNGTVTWDERRDNCALKFLVCCTQYKHAVKCSPICALNKTYINLISYNLFMCLHI